MEMNCKRANQLIGCCGLDCKTCDARIAANSPFVLENPNLVIPLDALRKLQKEGVFGELYPYFASTTGTGTATNSAAKFGDEIGKKLVEEHVDAVLLVST